MALWRADGVQVVALFNKNHDPSGLPYAKIQEIMDQAAGQIKHWPTADKARPEGGPDDRQSSD